MMSLTNFMTINPVIFEALDKRQLKGKVLFHFLVTMDLWINYIGNPCKRCRDIFVLIKMVDQQSI
ncbi:MAG: hypothetical protein ATN32_09645 [Candidatus Epulonipiscium fishelsonii]|nr:MAG: hypothetical protein ATN32_09645 [Epulopiscium sp. AS2M-Bin002]